MRLEEIGMKPTDKMWNGYTFYEDGLILGLKGCPKKVSKTPKGYASCHFKTPNGYKTKLVHTIVAELWLGTKPEGYEVDHINNNRFDYRPSNLQYLTKRDNIEKSHIESPRNNKGEKNPNHKLKDKDIEAIIEDYKNIKTNRYVLASVYKVTASTISRIRNNYKRGLYEDKL